MIPHRQPGLSVAPICDRCGRQLARGDVYDLGGARYCPRCAVRHGPLLLRSARTALLVGTILIAINQGTVLSAGDFPSALLWRIPLTYLVPFCVATWGALGAARR
jgi:hypothetical protein